MPQHYLSGCFLVRAIKDYFWDIINDHPVVDHGLLLKKLQLYGFDVKALKWMNSYLSGRSQAVYLDGAMSSFLSVEVGVPQGSILGPFSLPMTYLSPFWTPVPTSILVI